MNSLFARLSAALFLVVTLIGGGFFLVEQTSSRLYYEEVTQRLNASIAMYVTGEMQLMENGVVNDDALTLLAQRAMIINPTVEVYLLGKDGTILAHAMPPEAVVTKQVDLAPVQALIAGQTEMPLRGTDPRHTGREKIFSAHPVMHNDELQGYLYAILGGQKYDELASSVRGSYVQTLTLGALTAIVLGAFLVGLLVFGLLTRRLTRLTTDVTWFTDSGFDPDLQPELTGQLESRSDEIGRLRNAFASMAGKIQQQFDSLQETDRLRR